MTRQLINTGILPNDGQGDSLRDAGTKLNSTSELYTALGNGTALTIVRNQLLNATGSNKVSFLYTNFSDLPDASTYHGMFRPVHSENASYYVSMQVHGLTQMRTNPIDILSDVDINSGSQKRTSTCLGPKVQANGNQEQSLKVAVAVVQLPS